jgi:non-ribosomal peptide synthetase component F
MIRMNVDWAYFTPTFARFFRWYTIPGLKQLILGGEAVTVDDVRDWVGKVRVLNVYGPAEFVLVQSILSSRSTQFSIVIISE